MAAPRMTSPQTTRMAIVTGLIPLSFRQLAETVKYIVRHLLERAWPEPVPPRRTMPSMPGRSRVPLPTRAASLKMASLPSAAFAHAHAPPIHLPNSAGLRQRFWSRMHSSCVLLPHCAKLGNVLKVLRAARLGFELEQIIDSA